MRVDYCKEDLILKVFPTVGGCFEEAWSVLKNHFLILLLAIIVSGLIEIPMGFNQMGWKDKDSLSIGLSSIQFFGFLYYFLIITPFNYGVDWMFLKAARKTEPQFEEILNGFKKFLFVILSHLLVIGIVGMGFVFLILPGIYLACKMIFVPFLIMDKKVDPIQAVKLSYYLSKGYFWTIFGMAILSFFVFLLGFICLFVGVFVSIVWIHSAFAVLYKALDDLHFEEACKLAGISSVSVMNEK
ncbi:hypothetical protein BZG02_19215 [Labilibaculum filiforme]|uniref:Glycerophosphoryl diester phosphodiesterase membrane domain-containing protein n=1 Tax=Labilibaculum filiforme TaxID=1940526 RepID=A0A2N3HQZ9_9BACT|nr:hypothetical protein [Labilibaculum filiforme]PKQ60484.1 hypothetical protein BZG02_19215 [Labilibaculum filiforme]